MYGGIRGVFGEGHMITDIRESVREVLAEQLGCSADSVKPTTDLIDDLGMDSLDAVELQIAFEDRLGMEIPDEAIESVRTVEQLVACLQRLLRPSVGREVVLDNDETEGGDDV